jgi:hypothetical protein
MIYKTADKEDKKEKNIKEEHSILLGKCRPNP